MPDSDDISISANGINWFEYKIFWGSCDSIHWLNPYTQRKLISLHNNAEDDKHAHGYADF
jgi:hypothetical protein